MGWPQWVVLCGYALGVVAKFIEVVKNRDLPSPRATAIVFFTAAIYGGNAAVLHAGGFW